MAHWWTHASASPYSFRDAASVGSLIDGVLAGKPKAAHALSSVVKALEDEPDEESQELLTRRLPEISFGLTVPDLGGDTISIMRRIRPDRLTVDRLLVLLDETAPGDRVLVVVALGLIDDGAGWSERVENALVEQLTSEPCVAAAADALYGAAWQNRLERPSTFEALARIAQLGVWPACDHAALALVLAVAGDHARLALPALENLLASATEAVRVKIAEGLGWRTITLGCDLLERCLHDPSAMVAAAARASIVRRAAR